MKMSTKARYGLYAAVKLATDYDKGLLPVSVLSTAIGVTDKYLEQILSLLKADGIVNSVRGAYGGYQLSDTPDKISVGKVLRAVENDLKIVDCIGKQCPTSCTCVSHNLWTKLYQNINEYLDGISLQQLLEDKI